MHQYYIHMDGKLDGPHDLVTIMRRIRAGKITANTQIFSDGAAAPLPASFISEIAGFFDHHSLPSAPGKKGTSAAPSLSALISSGWRFTMEHNIMTVYSGGLLLVSILLLAGLVDMFGTLIGGLATWCVFFTLHNFYLLFVLRLHRGQMPGTEFINKYIAPVLPVLVFTCVLLALLTSIGCLLTVAFPSMFAFIPDERISRTLLMTMAVIPGTFIALFYIFAPFLILDHRYHLLEAMQGSRTLLVKHGESYVGTAACLVLLHVLCLLLIIPIPLTLPLFAAALSELYEDIAAS